MIELPILSQFVHQDFCRFALMFLRRKRAEGVKPQYCSFRYLVHIFSLVALATAQATAARNLPLRFALWNGHGWQMAMILTALNNVRKM